jgi:molybdenum cofactor cytidylyltransferase
MANVGAVILAAGDSSRFGKPKQLVAFRGQPLLDRAIIAASAAGCRPIIVVTQNAADAISQLVATHDPIAVENPDWSEGIAASIRLGVQRLLQVAPDIQSVVLMVCDQPFASHAVVTNLIQQWAETRKSIVASAYSNTLGVPALFDRSCFPKLLQLRGDTGAKSVILKNLARVATMPFPEGNYDIDTAADLAEAESAGDRKKDGI